MRSAERERRALRVGWGRWAVEEGRVVGVGVVVAVVVVEVMVEEEEERCFWGGWGCGDAGIGEEAEAEDSRQERRETA